MADKMSTLEHLRTYRHAYQLTAAACMGSIFYGWDIGLIGGVIAMDSFKTYFEVTKLDANAKANLNGNIVSILQGGCFFGALFTGYFSGRFGRKPTLIASGIIYILGSVIQSIVGLGSSASTALSVLYFGRFVGGVGVGMVSALVPSYVSESVPKAIRGRCTGSIQFSNNVGIMLSFWVNYSTVQRDIGDYQWRLPFIVQLVPGVIFTFAMLFQPESPRWLVEHGQRERAAQSLASAAGKTANDPAVQYTLAEIEEEFSGRAQIPLWRQFPLMGETRVTALRCFIPSLVMFFQQWTGTNAINYFSPQIFAGLGLSSTTSTLFATGIYGVVKVVAVGTVLVLAVERFGRKKCLLYGGILQSATMLWIGGFSAIHPQPTIIPASYVSLVAVYLYAVGYCIGWVSPAPWIVASEVAPNHLRTAVMAIAVGINWLFSFTISRITPILIQDIAYGTFLIFGLCCALMSLYVYFLLPETSGIALEDIHFLFEDHMLVRSLQDAPLGRIFLGGKRARPVDELRAEAEPDVMIVDDSKSDAKVSVHNAHPSTGRGISSV